MKLLAEKSLRGVWSEIELTTQTYSGSSVEWHETPSNTLQLWTQPSFGSETVPIIAIYTLLSVHVVYRISNTSMLWYKHGRISVWPTSRWKNCGFGSNSHVEGELGIQSLDYNDSNRIR